MTAPRAILFDLDGVLYQGDQPIPGAVETLDWVRTRGIPHLFLTNTSSRPRSALVERLARLGIRVEAGELHTPPAATLEWLGRHDLGGEALAAFVARATRGEFASLRLLDEAAESGAAAVIVGDLGEGWDFATLNRAFRLLMAGIQAGRPPALIALGMTRYWQAPDGLRLDTGPYVKGLAYATGIEPVVLGKPAEAFFAQALTRLGTQAAETLMIGDDIRGDIGGAQAAGLNGVLVRTGKFRPPDLEGPVRPQAVLDSIADLPAWWPRQERA